MKPTPSMRLLAAGTVAALASVAARARDANPATDLEQVTVYATSGSATAGAQVGGTVIAQDATRQFDRQTLDEALLLAAGTSISAVGARNETDVWIRGFDRWRVPLYQDGIPIYLPVDNRIDFGRFTTVDLAQIQVSRGFASVIDGPGAMGGAINLVSRVVTKPLEAEARVGTTLDSDGNYDASTADVFLGTRQSRWFVQAAGSLTKQEQFRLSDSFSPGTLQGSGDRLQSWHRDYNINLKAGYMPSENAQYSLNFIDQMGDKGNPPPDDVIPTAALKSVKYWTWPSWDKQSVYWLSRNVLDARDSYLKTRLYYDRFYNQLDSYDSLDYTTQNTPKSFDSTYDDRAAGGSVELDEVLAGGTDTVRAAGHYRWDEHQETEGTRNAPGAPWYQQPWERAAETTTSFALENIYHPTAAWDVIAGASYDLRHLNGDSQWVSSGTTPPFGYSFDYPVADKHALNGELAVVYRYRDGGSVHFSYADRARFPTLFEMYSTRFGTFQNNPDLKPERSHYAQAGVTDTLLATHVTLNVFLARVDDAIETLALSPTLSENVNSGSERREGYEIELTRTLLPTLDAGVNYSDLIRVNLGGSAVLTDTPNHKLFAFLDWRPVPALNVVPSVDVEGRRWLQNAVNNTVYYRGGDYTVVNLKAAWQFTLHVSLEAGSRNLTDENYVIEDGYHAPGRQYFLNLRAAL